MKYKLTSIQRYDKDKDGNPLKTRDGRPYTRLVVRTTRYGEKTISGFDSLATKDWREGDEVEMEIEQKGEYLNFKVPNKSDALQKIMEEVRNTQTKHTLLLQEVVSYVRKQQGIEPPSTDYPEEDIDPDDIPF